MPSLCGGGVLAAAYLGTFFRPELGPLFLSPDELVAWGFFAVLYAWVFLAQRRPAPDGGGSGWLSRPGPHRMTLMMPGPLPLIMPSFIYLVAAVAGGTILAHLGLRLIPGSGWTEFLRLLPLALLLALCARREHQSGPGQLLAPLAAGFLALWNFVALWPLPGQGFYFPFLGPLDLIQLLMAVTPLAWLYLHLKNRGSLDRPHRVFYLLAILIFVWLNLALGRLVHHWLSVPYNLRAITGSDTFQSLASLTWAAVGIAAMITGHRTRRRTQWLLGAILIVADVLKLFFVDLSQAETLTRVVSFICVGILLILVGWFAPLPPKGQTPPDPEGGNSEPEDQPGENAEPEESSEQPEQAGPDDLAPESEDSGPDDSNPDDPNPDDSGPENSGPASPAAALLLAAALGLMVLNPPAASAQKKNPVPAPPEAPAAVADFNQSFELQGVQPGALNRLILSPEVFLATQRSDLGDLAVFSQAGMQPLVLLRPGPRTEELPPKEYSLLFHSLAEAAGEGAAGLKLREPDGLELEVRRSGGPEGDSAFGVYVLDLSGPRAEERLDGGLDIYWDYPTYGDKARSLKLESSPDLSRWRVLRPEAVMLSGPIGEGMARGRLLLNLAPDSKYLRLSWLHRKGPEIKMAEWTAKGVSKTIPRPGLFSPVSGRLEKDSEGRPQLIYDLGGRPPLNSLNLSLAEAGSFESLLWARDADSEPWRRLGQVESFRYARPDGEAFVHNPSWPLAGRAPYRQYRLTPVGPWPDFAPAPPLDLEFPPLELVFLAGGQGPYTLAVGHDLAVRQPPAPPEAAQFSEERPLVSLGAAVVRPPRPAAPPEEPSLVGEEAAIWIFRGVLLAGLLLLTFLAIKIYRRAKLDSSSDKE